LAGNELKLPLYSIYSFSYKSSLLDPNILIRIFTSDNLNIQNVPGGKVNILGCHSKDVDVPYSERFPRESYGWYRRIKERQDALRRATCHVLTRVANCIAVDGEIFENILYQINCTNSIAWNINASIINNFGTVQWSTSILETVRIRTHVHIRFFLVRMTDMTSQNIDHSSWDTSYILLVVRETGLDSCKQQFW
jgi:hypothetical protein